MDGLRVPLIVYNPNEPFDYDHDEIITVSGKNLVALNNMHSIHYYI